MNSVVDICQWLEKSPVGTWARESPWAFPTLETAHLFGMIVLVGSTSMLDLRLLGMTFPEVRVSKMAGRMLPLAWSGFAVQVVTGFLMFCSEATKVYYTVPFRIKMVLILCAGINALVFHNTIYRSVDQWDSETATPLEARIAGATSLFLWIGIVTAGRWISYL